MSRRVLLIEDEVDLAFALRLNLSAEGYDVEVVHDGERGLALARKGPFDVVLLDLRLPGLDGLDVLRELRAGGVATPVICLTARAEEADRVLGLDLGADDYVTKPFSVAELLARMRAVARRGSGTAGRIDLGRVVLVLEDRSAVVDGERVPLTATETSILSYLAQRRGTAVSRDALLRDLWGVDGGSSTRTLDNHVARIRKKLERDPARPQVLETVHGEGYRLRSNQP